MTLTNLLSRVAAGEVVPCAAIEGNFPDEYINKYPKHFENLVVEDDFAAADVYWIYDKSIRAENEYNPCKQTTYRTTYI